MSLAMRKAVAECEAGNGLKSLNEALKKISPTLTASLDIESIKALTGMINWTSKEELEAPIAVLKYFSRYNVLQTIAKAFEKIAKDAIGKEAVQSEIGKLVVHVVQDDAQTGNFAVSWKVEKNAEKELHVTVGRHWATHAKDSNNGYPAEDSLAKLIEALL